MVKVSVIIPVYNAASFLAQCLDSILNQTLKNIEIICIDDGSTDNSLEILKKYQKRDERIEIISQENRGAGVARNVGLKIAKGQYLSFLDSDDFFDADMLMDVYEKAEATNADFVVFRSDQYHMDVDSYLPMKWSLKVHDIPPYDPFTYRQLTSNVFKVFVGWAWDKLYRTSFIQEHHLMFQEIRTSNDLLFVFSALIIAKRISVVDKVLAHHRRANSLALSVTREKSWHCFYLALKALKDRITQEGIFWELERDYVNYALHFSLWNLNTLTEPAYELLKQRLVFEWFNELGVCNKSPEYFYNKREYREYIKLVKKYV